MMQIVDEAFVAPGDDLTKPLPAHMQPSDHKISGFANGILIGMTGKRFGETYYGTTNENKVAKRRCRNKAARKSRRINRKH